MQESTNRIPLILLVDLGEDADTEELDLATRQLREDLEEFPVESIDLLKKQELPEGAKSAEAVTLGALSLVVLPELIPKIVEYLQSWTMRAENRKVTIKTQVGDRSIELEYAPAAMSPDEVKDLVKTLTKALK
jgi:hypothetical protein